MAKDSDKKAAALKADKAGARAGLLADEKEFDRRVLWRIGWWGTAALATVIVAVLANQGAQSWRRDRISAAELTRQVQQLQALARDNQNQTRQLTAAIETLNNDRDRLYARVTVLEQGLDSMTGTLAKQGAAQTPGKPQAAASPATPPTATADAQGAGQSSPPAAISGTGSGSSAAASNSPPSVAPVMTTTAWSDKTRADAGKPGGTSAAASPWPAQPSTTTPTAVAAAANPPSSSGSLLAPSKLAGTDKAAKPDAAPRSSPEPTSEAAADSKPDGAKSNSAKSDSAKSDSTKSDSGPQTEANAGTAGPDEAAPAAVQKTEFAVDLGGANTVNGLRALWRGLSKSNSDLAALGPIIMVKEGNPGQGPLLRLGAGPLNDAAAAAKICASLAERRRPCETTVYDGQRLTASEAAAGSEATKPATVGQKPATTTATAGSPVPPRRRVWQHERHGAVHDAPPAPPPPAAAAPPPEPPKPEPSTFSSLFHRQQPQQ